MDERNNRFAGRMVRERTRERPMRLSPNVVESGGERKGLPSIQDGGLHEVQTAVSIIQRKIQERDSLDASGDAAKETMEDSRTTITTTTTLAKKMIRHGRDKRKQARLSASVREYEAKKMAGDKAARGENQNTVALNAVRQKQNMNRDTGKPMVQDNRTASPDIMTRASAAVSKEAPVYHAQEDASKAAPKAVASKKIRSEAVTAARKSAQRGAKTAGKAAAKSAKAVGRAAGSSLKALVPAMIAVWPVFLILLILVIILVISLSPMGMFFTDNEDSPNKASEIVAQIEREWLDELAATRKQYEDQGYAVNVYYGVNIGDDSSRVNNWKDCLSLYAVMSADGEQAMLVLTDEDTTEIRGLFFQMNPISVEIWTETVETEVEKEVEKTEWVWNASKKKFEQVTTTEIVTETETETIEHADIEILNRRLPEMLGEYPLSEEEQKYAIFLMSAENEPLWNQIGIKTLQDGSYAGDISDIIRDLPPGTIGTSVAEEAAKYLGMPYVLGGTGNGTIDCSGLTQIVYAKFGISLPHSAAEQARICVEGGKIVDTSAAQPGDLVFYTSTSGRVADRFMKIGHVGIVVGNGMMIDASSSNGCVVYRKIYGSPIYYGRPHV
ncbi:NlpC/P60 family protein [Christensenellaceae bacterium OttesenSCG-928-K19]|nr:NlpC/P60 family protein [Christensenellaceae bacterium OttesenSCG-928-K19]